MPKSPLSPVQRITALFLDLDGGEMETVIDIFKAIHRRRTARLTPVKQVTKTTPKPKVKAEEVAS